MERPSKLNSKNIFQFSVVILFSASFFLFQNCGKSVHSELPQASVAVTSTPEPNPLYLMDAAGQNTPFRVSASSGKFSTGTEFYWSAIYPADSTFCSQTISNDNLVASFTCTAAGKIIARLTATETTGDLHEFSLPLVVGANGTFPQPQPQPSPGPAPAPAPAPMPMPAPAPDGAALYSSKCSSCHGPLASSNKRGISRSQLDAALNNVGAMANLRGLTPAERDAIIQSLQ